MTRTRVGKYRRLLTMLIVLLLQAARPWSTPQPEGEAKPKAADCQYLRGSI